MARLLVVDDEQSMRVMLEARLTKAGHAVEVAADVPGVERALAASEFDVVITDLRMRTGDDGLRVLRKVKDAEAEVEVILMTAFGSDDVRQKALELGAYGYVEKSATPRGRSQAPKPPRKGSSGPRRTGRSSSTRSVSCRSTSR